jgi:hypothetical protein
MGKAKYAVDFGAVDMGHVPYTRGWLLPLGTRVWFKGEKKPYRVRASNVDFAIMTKPMNLFHTVLYTIIDWNNNIRGAEDLIFCRGAETDEQCKAMLKRLSDGDSEVSRRNCCKLEITRIDNGKS